MTFGLNLLPRDAKHTVALEDLFERWRGGLVVTLILLIAATGVGFGANMMLARRVTSLDAQILSQQIQSGHTGTADTVVTITKLNSAIALLNGAVVHTQKSSWSSTIRTINGIFPADVAIQKLEVKSAGQIEFSGIAATRSAFLALQQLMKTTTVLTNPLSSNTASQRENLPFSYTATLSPAS